MPLRRERSETDANHLLVHVSLSLKLEVDDILFLSVSRRMLIICYVSSKSMRCALCVNCIYLSLPFFSVKVNSLKTHEEFQLTALAAYHDPGEVVLRAFQSVNDELKRSSGYTLGLGHSDPARRSLFVHGIISVRKYLSDVGTDSAFKWILFYPNLVMNLKQFIKLKRINDLSALCIYIELVNHH